MKPLLLLLAVATLAQADIVAYRFADGKVYANTANGPELVTIVDLPTGPTDPDKPTTDKFGLIKKSREAADAVQEYESKQEHRTKLSAYYEALGNSVAAGSIPPDKMAAAVDLTFAQAVGSDAPKWSGWKAATSMSVTSQADAAQALRDIAEGLVPKDARAVDWAALIKFFVEVILPLIIKLIGSGA